MVRGKQGREEAQMWRDAKGQEKMQQAVQEEEQEEQEEEEEEVLLG
jgi:hypothetical protein